MSTRSIVFSIAIFAFLIQPFGLLAQTSGNWAAVKALGNGAEVRVETKAGKKVDGNFISASDTRISVSQNGKTEDIDAGDVKKVYRKDNASRGKGIAIGAAVGGGVGAAIGGGTLAATGGSDNTGGVIAPFIIVGTGIGALIGGLMPRKKRTLIYEAV